MQFSSNFGTAIHTLLIISEYSKTRKVTSEVIAEQLGTGSVAVRRLLCILKKAGFIRVAASRKEKEGTTMARPLEEITLLDIFEAVEPDCLKIMSASSTRLSNISYTGIYANEIISGYVKTAINAVRSEFGGITLADTLAELKEKEANCLHENPRELFSED